MLAVKKKFGDERKTEIEYLANEISIEDLIEEEDVVITVSHLGYIKRTSATEYRTQKRGGRGAMGGKTREEDYIDQLFIASTHATLLIFTDKGRCYWLKVYEIPEGEKSGKGRAIQNLLQLPQDEKVKTIINVADLSNEEYVEKRYDSYGELTNYMSHLRLGYVFGVVKEKINSILDVGYGNGSFLKVCKKTIPNCYGHDVTNYKLPEGVEFVNNWIESETDVTTFFDVIEHLDDPYIVKNLKTKYIIISVPWCHYESDEWFENWKHRRPNEHLWHFNGSSMKIRS
jgi:hypothetical protein